jgi:hypothetical protein
MSIPLQILSSPCFRILVSSLKLHSVKRKYLRSSNKKWLITFFLVHVFLKMQEQLLPPCFVQSFTKIEWNDLHAKLHKNSMKWPTCKASQECNKHNEQILTLVYALAHTSFVCTSFCEKLMITLDSILSSTMICWVEKPSYTNPNTRPRI